MRLLSTSELDYHQPASVYPLYRHACNKVRVDLNRPPTMPSMQTSLPAAAFFLARLSLAQFVTFDFLTYNVAGLPDIINDNEVPGDKAEVAGMIGSKLAEGAYDVVHLQEACQFPAL